jgi:hypothetical protein
LPTAYQAADERLLVGKTAKFSPWGVKTNELVSTLAWYIFKSQQVTVALLLSKHLFLNIRF